MASTVLPNGIIVPEKFSRDWYADLYHNWQELDNLLGGGTPKDGTLTIQQNGDTVGTFSANQATDETIDIEVPTKTSDLTNDSGFITGVSWDDVSDKPSFATVATSGSYNDLSNKPTIPTVNDATLTIQKNGTTINTFTANSSTDKTVNIQCVDLNSNQTVGGIKTFSNAPVVGSINLDGKTIDTDANGNMTFNGNKVLTNANLTFSYDSNTTQTVNGVSVTYDIHDADAVPRSGGAVMTGTTLFRTANDLYMTLGGGTGWNDGAYIQLNGANLNSGAGDIRLIPLGPMGTYKEMRLKPDGTWTWNGTACQITSDQRLKQQINQIDDKLLNAWEDVNLVQFKYNDAVDAKKDKARLHTGYVVQQIDSACKSHGVDISEYGLYCHEEYPQETEEVEVEQKDGTKTKETKVIREASEHYSLRYTEVYAVECMYLRRCIARLTARIEELEKGNNTK